MKSARDEKVALDETVVLENENNRLKIRIRELESGKKVTQEILDQNEQLVKENELLRKKLKELAERMLLYMEA